MNLSAVSRVNFFAEISISGNFGTKIVDDEHCRYVFTYFVRSRLDRNQHRTPTPVVALAVTASNLKWTRIGQGAAGAARMRVSRVEPLPLRGARSIADVVSKTCNLSHVERS